MTTLLRDTFTGADGTAIAAHMPNLGGPWISDTPGFKIQGNRLGTTATSQECHVDLPVGKTARISATFDVGTLQEGDSFVLEWSDNNAQRVIVRFFSDHVEVEMRGAELVFNDSLWGGYGGGSTAFALNIGPGTVQFKLNKQSRVIASRVPIGCFPNVGFDINCQLASADTRCYLDNLTITT